MFNRFLKLGKGQTELKVDPIGIFVCYKFNFFSFFQNIFNNMNIVGVYIFYGSYDSAL